ncbi:MAG: glycoside hydrolase family 16 protein [Pontiellaceae bacterium]|jgi:hypothetical protein|nr:glycoside hydrolase family 16 protein [Pontiellaceae bacterium]
MDRTSYGNGITHRRSRIPGALVTVALCLLSSWISLAEAAGLPAIEFVHVPAYGLSDDLTGRVTNVNPSACGVAVYIYIGGWWTKPTFANPLSLIQTNGTWTCDITTGGSDMYASQIAAYLVPANYAPPLAEGWPQLPAELDSNAVAQVRVTRPFTRQLGFSGYEWSVKDSRNQRTGPGDNYFSDSISNVWVDAQGLLHLKICKRSGLWSCAELVSLRNFGYGTYRIFLESPANALDTNAVLGLFTWNDDAPYAHREIDVEVSRWGNASDSNTAQFVVQPWNESGHLTRYRVPATFSNSTHSFTWHSNRIDFACYPGRFILPPASNTAAAQWSFGSNGVPQTGGENFRINLWLCNTNGTTDGLDEEVVISRFVFVPENLPRPVLTQTREPDSGAFAIDAAAEPQLTYQVEASSNLTAWSVLSTLTMTNSSLSFTDTELPLPPRRFYRLTVPPQ